jgi:hypothetical protein
MASNPSLEDLNASIQNLIISQQNFQNHVADEIHGLRSRLGPPGFQLNVPTVTTPTTSIKLDIPRFDGTDSMGWIFKINQFFDYHLTPDEQRKFGAYRLLPQVCQELCHHCFSSDCTTQKGSLYLVQPSPRGF